jgi:hypothetical protein
MDCSIRGRSYSNGRQASFLNHVIYRTRSNALLTWSVWSIFFIRDDSVFRAPSVYHLFQFLSSIQHV